MHGVALRDRDLAVLRSAFRRFPCVKEVKVFGSRVTGQARRTSDLDLAVTAPGASDTEWTDVAGAIEEAPVVYEIDVVRTERTRNARLLDTIAREGIRIYPE
jgi:predicted nucleotidyltransferase